MKSVLRILLPMVLILGYAAPAVPQIYDDNLQYMPVPDDWELLGAGGSANVYYCSAKGSWGGSCIDCTVPRDKPTASPSCTSVYYSASCNCDGLKCSTGKSGATTGSCNYQP